MVNVRFAAVTLRLQIFGIMKLGVTDYQARRIRPHSKMA